MQKTAFIKIRVTPAEKAAYQRAVYARGQDLSDIIRAALDRAVRKAEKDQANVTE